MTRTLLPILLLLAATVAPLPAQAPVPAAGSSDSAWNAPRALSLIQRAQERRLAANADSGLTSYRSDARIFVYFYLDRPDTGERNLVKTDQLALEVFWQAPDFTKQRIVGWRDEKSLPTNINYHLDHLTVVQENFGDEIRLGDGDEVTDVVHPAAPGAEEVYEYRLVDSLTLRLPGAEEPVRVYELQVRPLDPRSPGFLGSVFVEQRAGDIVRMDFTFTESSYVDRYLDYINISLDNGLWQGRFWLPNQQRVEIRRRIPELDIPAGSVIRANMRVGNYRFDEPMPQRFFSGDAVIALPRAQREAFPFEEDIHAEVREEGIGPQAELGEIRRVAAELLRERGLRPSPRLRLSVGGASQTLRYGRAEGLALEAGAAVAPYPGLRLTPRVGWAFGPAHPVASLALASGSSDLGVEARFYVNRQQDIGVGPVASGAVNTLAALFAGEDYQDPYFTSGGAVEVSYRFQGPWSVALQGRAERQRSASREAAFSFFGDLRPVRPIDPTDLFVGGGLALRRSAPAEAATRLDLELSLDGGELTPVAGAVPGPAATLRYLRPRLEIDWQRRWFRGDATLALNASGGAAFGDLPVQALYLVGGRGTIPGYDFRAYGGDRFAAARAVYASDIRFPWLRGRLLGAAGWAGAGEAGTPALGRAGARTTGSILPSLGVGVGLLHDMLQVDVARGLGSGGRWEVIVEANRTFWDFL